MPVAQRPYKANPARVARRTSRNPGGSSQVARAVAEWAKQFDAKLLRLTERQDAFLKSLERSSARQD